MFSSKTPRPLFFSMTPFTSTNAPCHLSTKHDAHGQTHLHILITLHGADSLNKTRSPILKFNPTAG